MNASPKDRVKVVSALILNDRGEMLMTLRRPDARRPSCWENPGGKVEDGETDEEALRREMAEELGVTARIGQIVSTARLDLEVTLFMLLYHVIIIGDPKPLASEGIAWKLPSQVIVWGSCAPATYLYYRDIENFLTRKWPALGA